MSAMIPVTILRADANLQTQFTNRLWTLFHDIPRLYDALLKAFAADGITASDIKADSGDGSLGGFAVGFSLIDARTTVRVRLEQLQYTCLEWSVPARQKAPQGIQTLLSAVRAGSDDLSFSGHTITYTCHANLDGPTGDFLAQFASNVPKHNRLGPYLGGGVGFYYGQSGGVLGSSLIMERSVAYAGALFLRAVVVLDGRIDKGPQIVENADEYIRLLVGAAGLELPED